MEGQSKSVIVIGGGLAGLACAVALAEAGSHVRVFEKRPHLGGRATSYLLPNGEYVDNCQHVTLGCCTNLADFYDRIGAANKIRFYRRLVFVDRRGRRGVVKSSGLPPPFHLAPSFALFQSLNWADKWAIARAMLFIVRRGGHPSDADGATMLDWLRRHGQTREAIERFWRVVLVSAVNEELERTEARYAVDVFWKAFLANRNGFPVGIPAVPLADLYDGCQAAIASRGGEVRTRAGIREIEVSQTGVACVRLEDGTEVRGDFYVAAVPHEALLGILPQSWIEREPTFALLRNLGTSPITGIHLWFDRPVMAEPFLTLLERTVQWIFNKSLLSAATSDEGQSPAGFTKQGSFSPSSSADTGQYLQLVISASYNLVPRSRQEIIDHCRAELLDVLPATREARLVKATVIKETAATFSPAPGCDRWRPGQQSPLKNLFLAGDWTQTGWPATMEGAVRSGYLAAEAVLNAAGRPQKLLRADLPVEGLARLWRRG